MTANTEKIAVKKIIEGDYQWNQFDFTDQRMLGHVESIPLYNKEDYYQKEERSLIAMVPQQVLMRLEYRIQDIIIGYSFITMLFNIGMLIFLSKNAKNKLMNLFEEVAASSKEESPIEIEKDREIPMDLFDEFIQQIKTLTRAEKQIFNLYVEGKTPKEVTEVLFITINTLKTHNKHIYSKLSISSKEELLLYVRLLRKCNLYPEI